MPSTFTYKTPEELRAEADAIEAAKAKKALLPEKTAWIVTLESHGQSAWEKKIVAESWLYENGTAATSFNAVAFFDLPGGKGNRVAAVNFNSMISIVKVPTTGLPS